MCFVLNVMKGDPAFCSGSSCCESLIVADVWVFAFWIGRLSRLYVTLPCPPQIIRFTDLTILEKNQFQNRGESCCRYLCPWQGGLELDDLKGLFQPEIVLGLYTKLFWFQWGKFFFWSAVGCIALFSSQLNDLGRQNHILLAVETLSVRRNFILGGNLGECFLLTGAGLHLGCKQVGLGH